MSADDNVVEPYRDELPEYGGSDETSVPGNEDLRGFIREEGFCGIEKGKKV